MIVDWYPVNAAPRDGTPMILWIDGDEAPPSAPVTVGFWVTEHTTGLSYWRVFGDQDSRRSYVDKRIRGWTPLLRDCDA
jgi:hypothetical protein